jgi:hypothetical protein
MINLDRLEIIGQLLIDTPRGGRISITGDTATALRVEGSGYRALRAFSKISEQLPGFPKTQDLIFQRNPLGQDLVITVKGKGLVEWPAGKRMRVTNPIRALRFLAAG